MRRTQLTSSIVSSLALWALLASSAWASCIGDCDGRGSVNVAEIVMATQIAQGELPVNYCIRADANFDEQITIDEIIRAVANVLGTCEPPVRCEFTVADEQRMCAVDADCTITSLSCCSCFFGPEVAVNQAGAQALSVTRLYCCGRCPSPPHPHRCLATPRCVAGRCEASAS